MKRFPNKRITPPPHSWIGALIYCLIFAACIGITERPDATDLASSGSTKGARATSTSTPMPSSTPASALTHSSSVCQATEFYAYSAEPAIQKKCVICHESSQGFPLHTGSPLTLTALQENYDRAYAKLLLDDGSNRDLNPILSYPLGNSHPQILTNGDEYYTEIKEWIDEERSAICQAQ